MNHILLGFEQQINKIQGAMKQLGTGLNQAQIHWKDKQYQALFHSISPITESSKRMNKAGKELEEQLRQFEALASKEY